MKPSVIRGVEDLLGWGPLSELDIIVLTIGAYIMLHKRLATGGVLLALALVIGWGITRDPLVLAAALLVGFVTGLIAWLLR